MGSRRFSGEQQGEIAGVVHRNIRALMEVRRQIDQQRNIQDRAVDAITSFTGSVRFVFLHVLLFGGWLVINSGLIPGIEPFDPFPFVMLITWGCASSAKGWRS